MTIRPLAVVLAALSLARPAHAAPVAPPVPAALPATVAAASDAGTEIPEALSDRLQELQDLVDRQDAEMDRQGTLLQQVDRALAPAVTGSVGTRYQFASTFSGAPLANLPQTRLRLGVQSRQPGPLRYEVRLVTGAADLPNQSWVPFGAFWGKTPVFLDRYALGWRPWEPLDITVGKFADPFANSELLWDNDVQPAGLVAALNLKHVLPAGLSGAVTAGPLVLAANGSDGGAYAAAAKVAFSHETSPWLKLDLAASYLDFINAGAMANPATTLGPRPALALRNRLDDSGTSLRYDYNLVNLFGRATFELWPDTPLRLTADYVLNTAAPDRNRGLRLAAFLGSVKDPGGVLGVYRFKYVESDAILSALAEDISGGSDIVAHEVSVTARLLPKTFAEGTVQVLNRLSVAGAPLWHFRLAVLQEF
jgi:hypothetical protein